MEYRYIRTKLKHPFRLSLKGKIADLGPLELSQAGNAKRHFDIVDPAGLYIPCCAMKHNARSPALENFQDVILYYGLGRGPIGSAQGKLYLMDDAFIVRVGEPSSSGFMKTEQLNVERKTASTPSSLASVNRSSSTGIIKKKRFIID